MLDLEGMEVLITGAYGFLGTHVARELANNGCTIYAPSRKEWDLRERRDVEEVFDMSHPDIVVHLAASVGGIEANAANPGKYFFDNIIMGAHVMDVARIHGVSKYVQVGTSCSYPAVAPTPVKETDLWMGPPNEVTGPYGVAKLALITMAQAYRKQYGLNAISLIPVNLYGPGDTFDMAKCHVIPALIAKALEAKRTGESLIVWGTGKATREFLYVYDAVVAIRKAIQFYDKPEPINLGTGVEIPIKELAETIAEAVGFRGDIVFDKTKPDGQLRRCFDVSRAKEEFGFIAKMPFKQGIKNAVEYYLNEQGLTSRS